MPGVRIPKQAPHARADGGCCGASWEKQSRHGQGREHPSQLLPVRALHLHCERPCQFLPSAWLRILHPQPNLLQCKDASVRSNALWRMLISRLALSTSASLTLHEPVEDVYFYLDDPHEVCLQDPRSGEVIEKDLYVTRKGATPAAEGQMGLIPGSMGQSAASSSARTADNVSMDWNHVHVPVLHLAAASVINL